MKDASQPAARQVFTDDSRFAVKRKAGDAGPGMLDGYAVVWNQPSSDRGGYSVRLKPGSAKWTVPTLALYHHSFRDIIGNTENGTLRLFSDDVGVRVEIDLPNTQAGRDVAELVEKKYVRGMSFAMVGSPEFTETREDGRDVMDVSAFTLDEVTVTGIPSFTGTSVSLRPATPPASPANQQHTDNRHDQAGEFARLDQMRHAFYALDLDGPAEIRPAADQKAAAA